MRTDHTNQHSVDSSVRASANALAAEKSPYLLQHADNPVDWHPWGDAAFALAREQDKPVFLSIGYSTCHWCHVMAHESFEDADVAALMNDTFVNIKVDREERPDIDALYMTVCQGMTGQGGWPLTIVMTPDRRPFFAATYLPKSSRHGRLGMQELIPRIAEIWRDSRSDVDSSAQGIMQHLHAAAERARAGGGPRADATTVARAAQELADRFDARYGGFGDAPKFPSPHNLLLLLRHAVRTGERKSFSMVLHTLQAMRMGGLFDHVGYGFHRYSTDARWLLPHFEKMLYDQAMLAWAYVEAWLAAGDARFSDLCSPERRDMLRSTAEAVFDYVMRDMTDARGGFRSAEDADSLTDGGHLEEGWFYTFTYDEVAALSDDVASTAVQVFSVRPEGNFAEEATGRRSGRNILHCTRSLGEWSQELGMTGPELADRLHAARQELYALRAYRTRPHLDDKVLADWNGLMISALARGARAFDAPQYAVAAARAARFVLRTMRGGTGALLHRYRDGEAAIPAMLDDYAFLIHGLIDLYQAAPDPMWLSEALRLQEEQEARFADGEGGYFLTASDTEDTLPLRTMDAVDGALPSGNSIALYNVLRLSQMLARPDLEARADMLIRAFSAQTQRMPAAFGMLLCGVDMAEHGGRTVLVCGHPDTPDTESLLRTVHGAYLPDTTLLFRSITADAAADDGPESVSGRGADDGADVHSLSRLVPFTAHQGLVEGKAAAYLCADHTCSRPVSDVEELRRNLGL